MPVAGTCRGGRAISVTAKLKLAATEAVSVILIQAKTTSPTVSSTTAIVAPCSEELKIFLATEPSEDNTRVPVSS